MMTKTIKTIKHIYAVTNQRIKLRLTLIYEADAITGYQIYLTDDYGAYTARYLDKVNEQIKEDALKEGVAYQPTTIDKIRMLLDKAVKKDLRNKHAHVEFVGDYTLKVCM